MGNNSTGYLDDEREAIEALCVSWSEDGNEWNELAQLDNIHGGHKKRHEIKNYGGDYYRCTEFGIFGRTVQWDLVLNMYCIEMEKQMGGATIAEGIVQIIWRYLVLPRLE